MDPILKLKLARLKLGKTGARNDKRTLTAARYMKALPPPPTAVDWTAKIGPLGQMINDCLGDCTIAAAGHLIQSWTGNASGSPTIVPDSAILSAYEGACGYDPSRPGTDQGGCEIDVLNYWREHGVNGDKIDSYISLNTVDRTEVEQGVQRFGGIYVGAELPTSAQGQTGSVWDVTSSSPSDAGSWGGHAFPVLAYDQTGLTCITWGALQKMTWAWFRTYVDEAYAILTPDWIEADGQSPSGFDLAQLQLDLAAITA